MNTDKIYAESIAKEYAPRNDSKVVALKKLDQKAKLPATATAYAVGIVSALVLGMGMCLSMHVIGAATTGMLILGIILGLIGIAGVSVNYPLYKRLLEQGKKQYAGDIIRLAQEISSEAK